MKRYDGGRRTTFEREERYGCTGECAFFCFFFEDLTSVPNSLNPRNISIIHLPKLIGEY